MPTNPTSKDPWRIIDIKAITYPTKFGQTLLGTLSRNNDNERRYFTIEMYNIKTGENLTLKELSIAILDVEAKTLNLEGGQ